MGGTWGWVPGPVVAPAVYAPAQVAFVGGDNLRLPVASALVSAVAWFALAPREVYYPPYQASREYNDRINRSNTVVNNTTVINNATVVNNTSNVTNINTVVYANRSIPGAVVAVPTTIFVQSQPVARAVVQVSQEQLANRSASDRAAVAPTERSVHGGASAAGKPPAQVLERVVVARTAPPAAHAGIAAQLIQLAQQPGKPLDDAARKALKPAATAAVPIVKVVTVPLVTPPVAPPPPLARPAASAPVASVVPPASAPVTRPAASAPALPAAPPAAGASAAATPKAPLVGSAPAPNTPVRNASPASAPAPATAVVRVPAPAAVPTSAPVPPPVAQRPVEPKAPVPKVVVPAPPR